MYSKVFCLFAVTPLFLVFILCLVLVLIPLDVLSVSKLLYLLSSLDWKAVFKYRWVQRTSKIIIFHASPSWHAASQVALNTAEEKTKQLNHADAALTHLCINVFISLPQRSQMKINDTQTEKYIVIEQTSIITVQCVCVCRVNEDEIMVENKQQNISTHQTHTDSNNPRTLHSSLSLHTDLDCKNNHLTLDKLTAAF